MNYVDGFVAAVPTANKEAFITHAKIAAEVFKECGALSIVECWGDEIPDGEITSFNLATQCRDDERILFSWITWPGKTMRDTGMEKMMHDARM